MGEKISVEKLMDLYPFSYLSESERFLLARKTLVLYAKEGETLLKLGSKDARGLYILGGSVELIAEDDRSFTIEAGSEKAKKPVSHLIPHRYTVVSKSDVEYIWIENQVIDNVVAKELRHEENANNLEMPAGTISIPLFQAIYEDLASDNLVIPALPRVALKVREMCRGDADFNELKQLVLADPSISALLVKIANSPVYFQGTRLENIHDAILRIGVRPTCNYILCFAIKNLFKTRFPHIKKLMRRLWTHSTEVAAISHRLAFEVRGFDPAKAFLMGLLHDIGMLPMLCYAELHPDLANDPETFDRLISEYHGELGARILQEWNFSDEFIEVALEADDWQRDPAAKADYCDLVLIAQLHSFIGKSLNEEVPPITNKTLPVLAELPAFKKLGFDQHGPEHSTQILQEAKQQLAETFKMIA